MRYILLAGIFFLVSAFLFYSIYRFSVEKMKIEVSKSENIKIAENTKIVIFKNGGANWVLFGKRADFSDPKNIKIEQFRAENINTHLKVRATLAYFENLYGKIKLYKNVVINFLENGKPVIVETDSATVDTGRKLIYGEAKVVVRKERETLIGEGFRYDIKTGKFIILRNVQTYLISA